MLFEDNHERYTEELNSIFDLGNNNDWLTDINPSPWGKGRKIAVRFAIKINEEKIPLIIEYPKHFPYSPASVITLYPLIYSGHQYPHGELCLEYRADNWNDSVTGAMMIKSAYGLLSAESTSAKHFSKEVITPIPDGHNISEAQEILYHPFRAILTEDAEQMLYSLDMDQIYNCDISIPNDNTAFISSIFINKEKGKKWLEETMPCQDKRVQGFIIKQNSKKIKKVKANLPNLPSPLNKLNDNNFYIFVDEKNIEINRAMLQGNQQLAPYYNIKTKKQDLKRLGESYSKLTDRKVGIIGCGSLGSKIAVSLARAGIGKFILVDGDVFKPENMVRNELGSESIGLNKAQALSNKIKGISSAEISSHCLSYNEQMSSLEYNNSLEHFSSCDILVDATANSQAFNIIGGVAKNCETTLIWAEVYEGGIGGAVLRSRPGIDVDPYDVRDRYYAWCTSQDKKTPMGTSSAYTLNPDDDAEPLIADDSHVGIIANWATRMIIDNLVENNSKFPYSAYVIGFSEGWIFEQPFDVYPIKNLGIDAVNQSLESFKVPKNIEDIKIELSPDIEDKLKKELKDAGAKEIGGWLFAKRLKENHFRIIDFSVDKDSGLENEFIRYPSVHESYLNTFLDEHYQETETFSYIGEWHSHPTQKLQPSVTDIKTMNDIVAENEKIGFAILMIVKIQPKSKFKKTITLFCKNEQGEIIPKEIQ